MANINGELNGIEKELFPLIEYAKWELNNFGLLKKSKKIIQKELIIMDKDILKQWKEKSGYNIFKRQIFNYISSKNKIKDDKEKIKEQNLQLNTLWKKTLSDKKINPTNAKSIPKKDITGFFLNLKDKTINGYKSYEIISSKLYEIFKNYINDMIKINGFYNNGKLIIPLNYKNNINVNNAGNNFIEIIYINKKNEIEDFLYVLPNDINICNTIEKNLINDDIENLMNNIFSQINDQESMKEFDYKDVDGNITKYKVLNKKQLLNRNTKKDNSIKENKLIKPDNTKDNKNNNNTLLQNKNNLINKENEKDIDKLRQELFQKINILENLNQKVKERNNNLQKMKNDLEEEKNKFNEEKNLFYNEQNNNNNIYPNNNDSDNDDYNNNNDNNNLIEQKNKIEDLKNKCLMNEKEYEMKQQELSKKQKILSDKEKFLESFITKNNNAIKLKENEYNKKNEIFNNDEDEFEKKRMTLRNSTNHYLILEDNLRNKEDLLNKREEELNEREKQLKEREEKINEEKIKNNETEKELDDKLKELNDKLIYMKNKEYLMNIKKEEEDNLNVDEEDENEKELAKIQEELEEEMNLQNNQNKDINANNEDNNNNQNNESHTHMKKIKPTIKNIMLNSSVNNNYRSLSPNNLNKKNIYFTDKKNIDIRNTINTCTNNKSQNNNYKNDSRISLNLNYLRSKTISIKDSFNNNNSNNTFINRSNKNVSINPNVLQTQTKINKLGPSLGLERVDGPNNLNAIIQCFAHIPEVSEGILELGYNKFFKERKNTVLLSRNFATIVNNIFFPEKFNNNTRKYSPQTFVDTFLNMYPPDNSQGYLSTFKIVKFILKTFHDELNVRKNGNNIKDEEDIDNNNKIDNTNEKEVLVNFLTKLTENNNSLISKLFFGLTKLKCVCNDCGNMTYAFDYYSYLYFDLIKIKKYHMNNKFNNNKSIFLSLNDCLDYYTRTINLPISLKEINQSFLKKLHISEENGKIFCKKCDKEKNCTFYKSIYSAHTILPIILERGDDENYFIEELKFPDELNLENYVEFNKSIKKYYLCGVISNYGNNNTYGKFCAYCRMIPNGNWFSYKNEHVSSCTNQEVHQNGVPYMLFYHKV